MAESNHHPEPWDDTLIHLYRDHHERLVMSTQRLLRSRAAAEDVVQETFVRYHVSPLRPADGRELAYLRSIALNLARTRLRRERLGEHHRRQEWVIESSEESEWIRGIETATAVAHLSALPARQREVLAYRHLIGLSESETATMLSISPGSVKTHGSRARQRMRTLLAD